MDINLRKIPVFAFPNALKFHVGSKQTHKQLITIYNPYEFNIKYKVLCTAPNKFSVSDPEGNIRSQACVDLVVRHIMPISANCNVIDKFRITIHDSTTKQLLGKRDIEAKLVMEEPDNVSEDGGDDFHNISHSDKHSDDVRTAQFPIAHLRRPTNSGKYQYSAIILGLVCVCMLMLPDRPDTGGNFIAQFFYPTNCMRLCIVYVLGLLTAQIFARPF